jgi:hypothetical protein
MDTRITEELLNEVHNLNDSLNNGRGVGVLRSVIFYLENNDWHNACLVANTDADKLWQYEGAREKMQDLGLITFTLPDW